MSKVDDLNTLANGEINPYALLNSNFDRKLVDKEIDLFDSLQLKEVKNVKTSFISDQSKDSGHISNFTFDKEQLTFQGKMGSKLSLPHSPSNSNIDQD